MLQTKKAISLVVAMTQTGGIGLGGELPWKRIPSDMRRFHRLTKGRDVIMGRKTYDSICALLGNPLPGRHSIVMTYGSCPETTASTTFVNTLQEALDASLRSNEVFVIGGAEIYEAALLYATRMYVTWVLDEHRADTYFPRWDPDEWMVISEGIVTPKEGIPTQYDTYCRIIGT